MKRSLICAGLLVLSAACRVQDPAPAPAAEWIPVAFSLQGPGAESAAESAIAESAGTAAGTGVSETSGLRTRAGAAVPLEEGATLRVLVYRRAEGAGAPNLAQDTFVGEETFRAGADGSLTPCAVDAAGEATQDAASNDLFLRSGAYDFYALTPAVASADHRTVEVAHGMDFASSLTSAQIVPQSGGGPQTVTLETLQRRCSQVVCSITRQAENVSKAEISHVGLGRIAHSPAQASLTGPIPLGANDAEYVMPAGTPGPEPYQYAVADELLPRASAPFDLEIQVRFNGSPELSDLQAEIPAMAFEAGMRYTFDIKLEGGFIILELQITPWNVDAVWDTPVGEPPIITLVVGKWEIAGWTTDVGGVFIPVIDTTSWTVSGEWSTDVGD